MSDQKAEQIDGEMGSLSTGISHSSDTPSEPTAMVGAETKATADAPVSEPVALEPSLSEPSLSEPSMSEASEVEAAPAEVIAPASQPEPAREDILPLPGKVIVMPRADRAFAGHGIGPEVAGQESIFGKRRIAAMVAVVALATIAGALGGAFATATFMHGGSDVAANGGQSALETSLSRIDTDIQALKTGLEHTSKLGMNQFNKTSDRLDKLERAQTEPAAKLAKLSEAVDKLRTVPAAVPAAAAAVPVAAKDVTGSISVASAQPAPAQQATANPPKGEVGRLPTVEDWVLRDVGNGGALIDSRRGLYEVYAGDVVPGLGRVDAIRRQDGRWVVVTSRGLIVAR